MNAPVTRAARWLGIGVGVACVLGLLAGGLATVAQERGAPPGEWRYIGGDAAHTRYSPLDQINAGNFEKLQVAWMWRGDNFGPQVDHVFRSTPIYVDGILYTVAGQRRTVAAIDAATGETLWTYREPHTTRYERGMRNNYGKGVAYGGGGRPRRRSSTRLPRSSCTPSTPRPASTSRTGERPCRYPASRGAA